MEFMWVGIGGFLGANARYYLGRAITAWLGTAFPYGTFVVNLTGAFLIGVVATWLGGRYVTDAHLRQVLVIGFLGGYTTFSSYTFEAIGLLEAGRWQQAVLYVVGSNGLGLVACVLGMVLTRRLLLA